jgi:predicted DNA-binding protein
VVRELIENGIELMEIFSETVNLEEIFLQLTGDDQNINSFSSQTVSETSHNNRKGS